MRTLSLLPAFACLRALRSASSVVLAATIAVISGSACSEDSGGLSADGVGGGAAAGGSAGSGGVIAAGAAGAAGGAGSAASGAGGGAGGTSTGGASGAAAGGSGGFDAGAPDSSAGMAGSAGSAGDSQDAGDAAAPAGGPVALDNVFNARHTGGLTTSTNKRVRDYMLIRSGHLADLGGSGCAQLSALTIKTVIDLRDATDAAASPDAACVTTGTAYKLVDLPKILPPSATSYEQTLDAAEPKLASLFGQLTSAGLPAILHCVIGRDRASMVTALVLLALGVPQAQVVADFEINQDASVSVDAAWLQPVVDRVNQAGGIDAYLLSWGVTAQQLSDLRSMALE